MHMISMSFEVRDRDVIGRIGKLATKNGTITTPALMPVVHPVNQSIPPMRMKNEFGCEVLITNSYIIKKNFGDNPDINVHDLIDYDGVITTDSGAYQILVYGGVDTNPKEIIHFQQSIGSDIAVILDIPTGWDVPRSKVEYSVEETLRRARISLPLIEGDDTLWIGPVQGGAHLDLVKKSAKEIGDMPFQIHALGSPTEVMESYHYSVLADMIMAAKINLPPERPFHLFGAGHPMMFSFAVALGCDLFDSAAYVLFANDERYMTLRGTRHLKNLNYLPCSCPVCRKNDVSDIKNMLKGERVRLLAEHNLHVSMSEVQTIRQAISEGTLWELMETRSRGHPALTSALHHLGKYRDDLEKGSPMYKGRGIFIFDKASLVRPEITRHIKKLEKNTSRYSDTILLLPEPSRKPFNQSNEFTEITKKFKEASIENIQICFYTPPFGIILVELSETYPLSQFNIVEPVDHGILEFTVENVEKYLSKMNYKRIILLVGIDEIGERVKEKLEKMYIHNESILKVIQEENPWSPQVISQLLTVLK